MIEYVVPLLVGAVVFKFFFKFILKFLKFGILIFLVMTVIKML